MNNATPSTQSEPKLNTGGFAWDHWQDDVTQLKGLIDAALASYGAKDSGCLSVLFAAQHEAALLSIHMDTVNAAKSRDQVEIEALQKRLDKANDQG